MHFATMIIEALVLASTLSLDALFASFAYGSNKIKIPFSSVLTINLVCSAFLGVSLFLGSLLRPYLPQSASKLICFLILFIIGAVKLLDTVTKSIIRKHSTLSKSIRFSLFNFKLVLSIYADPEKADADGSKRLSPTEAFSLAVALSLDGMAVGFGAALGNVNGIALFLSSFAIGIGAVFLGSYMGNKVANVLRFDISWLSGAILIVLAFTKLL